jgi:hypothetical protein
MSNEDWLTQKLWRSFWFYVHIVYSAFCLAFRVYAIKHHEKDIGTCLRKDWHNAFLKLGRLLFVGPVVFIYFINVSKLENPRITNEVFYRECPMRPVPFLGRESLNTIGAWSHRCNALCGCVRGLCGMCGCASL